jgi:hypothetical protein
MRSPEKHLFFKLTWPMIYDPSIESDGRGFYFRRKGKKILDSRAALKAVWRQLRKQFRGKVSGLLNNPNCRNGECPTVERQAGDEGRGGERRWGPVVA